MKPAKAQAAAPEMNFASKSLPRHLARGAIGFGLIIGSIALVPVAGRSGGMVNPGGTVWRRPCRRRLHPGAGTPGRRGCRRA
ncbi:hypothetical protein SAMN05216532_0272 [Streptomyces sp. 2231.1]|nr:hypothetical protein SAMN05216532_0272 [Streptomyces sp. 2231.1]